MCRLYSWCEQKRVNLRKVWSGGVKPSYLSKYHRRSDFVKLAPAKWMMCHDNWDNEDEDENDDDCHHTSTSREQIYERWWDYLFFDIDAVQSFWTVYMLLLFFIWYCFIHQFFGQNLSFVNKMIIRLVMIFAWVRSFPDAVDLERICWWFRDGVGGGATLDLAALSRVGQVGSAVVAQSSKCSALGCVDHWWRYLQTWTSFLICNALGRFNPLVVRCASVVHCTTVCSRHWLLDLVLVQSLSCYTAAGAWCNPWVPLQ